MSTLLKSKLDNNGPNCYNIRSLQNHLNIYHMNWLKIHKDYKTKIQNYILTISHKD